MDLEVLIDEQTLAKRLDEMAKEVERDYNNEDITFICILKGSFPFTWELSKRLNKKNITFEFMEVSSYGNLLETSGQIVVKKDLSSSIENKNVIILEDIVDSGTTLSYLLDYLKSKNPKTIKIATLLDKPSRRIIDIPVNYIGFTIEDKFVLGFGLDFEQEYRNLPYIAYVKN